MVGNNGTGIAVVVIVQNDSETIEASMKSYYDHVDKILVTTDPKRGHSGVPIVPDNTADLIRALDKDDKIEIVEGDFVKYDDPMKNETYQRQFSADILSSQGRWKWILQIDADEMFLDFPSVVRQISHLRVAQALNWRWVNVFNILDDGRLLVVTNDDGIPNLVRFPLGHRPGATLSWARNVPRPTSPLYQVLKWRYEGGIKISDAVLHYSYAKSERRIREKLATFSHSGDFDADQFMSLWLSSKTNWQSMKNFHPLQPDAWPALRAFTLDELRALALRNAE